MSQTIDDLSNHLSAEADIQKPQSIFKKHTYEFIFSMINRSNCSYNHIMQNYYFIVLI